PGANALAMGRSEASMGPVNPQDLNRFSYVINNPMNRMDPNGHRPCYDDDCGRPYPPLTTPPSDLADRHPIPPPPSDLADSHSAPKPPSDMADRHPVPVASPEPLSDLGDRYSVAENPEDDKFLGAPGWGAATAIAQGGAFVTRYFEFPGLNHPVEETGDV